jgi:hypothetical protein
MSELGLDVELNGDSSNYDDGHAILNQDQHPCEEIMFSPSSNSTPSMPSINNEKIVHYPISKTNNAKKEMTRSQALC